MKAEEGFSKMKGALVAVGSALLLAVPMVVPELAIADPVAAIDVSDAETSITNQITPVTTIFLAMLGFSVLGAAFGLVNKALRR